MESSDNKTPSRPTPGRPSLLNNTPGPTSDKTSQTRMLASLEREGKVPGAVSAQRKPSRSKAGFAVLALVLAGGAGALYAFGPFDDGSTAVATATPARSASVPSAARAASVAIAAASAPASGAASAAAQIELAAASAPVAASAPAAASAPTVALAQADTASAPHVNPLDKLASTDGEAAGPPAPARAPTHKDKPHAVAAAPAKPQATTVAAAKPAAPHKARKAEDDADTELVAAIIARLDKRGSRPAPVAEAAPPPNVSQQVRQCSSNSDLLEARQCRNRACDGHWGKVDACPAARAPKTSHNEGADVGKRG